MQEKLDDENLDPQNWEEMRLLGHQMVDDMINHLASVRDRPVWRPPTEALAEHFRASAPQQPEAPAAVYQEFVQYILPNHLGVIHPRFWAWYMGSGTMMGAFAEMLSATMNSNTGAGNHVAMLVEKQVLEWVRTFLTMPEGSSGLLVSGGSMANLVGLVVARHATATYDFRADGYQFNDQHKGNIMRVYASSEIHSCNQKAVELMGMGHQSLVKIPVDENYKIRVDLLEAAIAKDLEAGYQPICVIASAGTVNTGAIDDLSKLADLCQKHKIWFHVDGAIGGVAMVSDVVRPMLAGIERADSIALDLHKWLHIPFEAGCIMVRNGAQHKSAFSLVPEYLAQEPTGVASGGAWFSEYGVQLSRQFRALKIWMSFKEHGLKKYGRMISKNVAQAHYLASLVKQQSELELCAPVSLDIVCFRWTHSGLSTTQLNSINKAILITLQEAGTAVPSYTTLNGKYCIRVAISNHRSVRSDFELLVNEVLRIGSLTHQRHT